MDLMYLKGTGDGPLFQGVYSMYGIVCSCGHKGEKGAISLFFETSTCAYSFSILLDRNKENGGKGTRQCVLVCVLSRLRVDRLLGSIFEGDLYDYI